MSSESLLPLGSGVARLSSQIDFTQPAFRRDPYPTYRWFREEAPLFEGVNPMGKRFWVLSRHADCVAVLRDASMSVDRPFQPKAPKEGAVDPAALHPLARALRAIGNVMLFRDPPAHTRLRGLVSRAFTPRTVERLRPRIASLVHELLDAHEGAGGIDLVRDLAEPLPILVIAELLGLPAKDREALKRWSDRLAVMLDGSIAAQHVAAAVQSAVEVVDYLREHLAERRRAPRNDLLSAMLAAQEKSDALSEDEIIGTALVVMGAGHETTTNLIGNTALALVRHPETFEAVRREPPLAERAVEECLRFDSPVQATSRVPTRDVELHGRRVAAGEEVALLIGAANRDPAVFPDADRLDVTRAENPHLAFGQGIHFCLGAGLARAEGQLALRALLERMPHPELARPEAELEWRPGWLLRGPASLPVRFAMSY